MRFGLLKWDGQPVSLACYVIRRQKIMFFNKNTQKTSCFCFNYNSCWAGARMQTILSALFFFSKLCTYLAFITICMCIFKMVVKLRMKNLFTFFKRGWKVTRMTWIFCQLVISSIKIGLKNGTEHFNTFPRWCTDPMQRSFCYPIEWKLYYNVMMWKMRKSTHLGLLRGQK